MGTAANEKKNRTFSLLKYLRMLSFDTELLSRLSWNQPISIYLIVCETCCLILSRYVYELLPSRGSNDGEEEFIQYTHTASSETKTSPRSLIFGAPGLALGGLFAVRGLIGP